MAIKKATELDFSNKKISMLLLARPGVGKTTLAMSAPRPLLIDLENGVDRVETCYRGDTSVTDSTLTDEQKYYEFINDITKSDLSDYDTIIIDTLGKLIELLTPIVIKENPVNGQKDGKTLSLKGYGAISIKVNEFTKMIEGLGKNVIYIAHVTETQDNDVIKTRVNIPGSTKDRIWDNIDLGGYMTYLGKDRVIYFSPSEQWDAKGTHGVTGMYKIPTLKDTKSGGKFSDNHFLTDLFNLVTTNMVNDNQSYKHNLEIYNKAMEYAKKINMCTSIDDINTIVDELKNVEHALTSKQELMSMLNTKVSELGGTYDKESKRYVASTTN
jgi:hypothetical protein